MQHLEGKQLVTKDGTKVPAETALAGKVIALYFSASWCPPCCEFTPLLKSVHEELVRREVAFQVVFLSFDRTAEDMALYMNELHGNWTAVPFNDPAIGLLKDQYQVHVIPKLIVIKNNGEVISWHGRKEIQDKGIAAFRLWADAAKPNMKKTPTLNAADTQQENIPDRKTSQRSKKKSKDPS